MGNYKRRKDENQKEIERQLRERAILFLDLSQSAGLFDLLVWHQGIWGLWEIKNPTKPKRDQRLTFTEKELADKLKAHKVIHWGVAFYLSDILQGHYFWVNGTAHE